MSPLSSAFLSHLHHPFSSFCCAGLIYPQRPRHRTGSGNSNARRSLFQRHQSNAVDAVSNLPPVILTEQVNQSHFENRSFLSFSTPAPGLYSLYTLQRSYPSDVDPTKKEEYLTDDVFRDVFGMDRQQFQGLPKWRRMLLKKSANLF